MRPDGLDHVALFVRDPLRSAAWYRDVLGLERRYEEAWGDYPVVMAAADGSGVALFPPRGGEVPIPEGARAPRVFAHVAFRVSAEGLREAMVILAGGAFPSTSRITASCGPSTCATRTGTK